MPQPCHVPRLLDLVDDPVPVRGCFNRYRCARSAARQRLANRSRSVLQTIRPRLAGVGFLVLHPRITLVAVKRDIFLHARLLSFFLSLNASLRRRPKSRFHIFILRGEPFSPRRISTDTRSRMLTLRFFGYPRRI